MAVLICLVTDENSLKTGDLKAFKGIDVE